MTCGPHVRAFGVVHNLSHIEEKKTMQSMFILLTKKPENHEQSFIVRIRYFKNSFCVGTRQPCQNRSGNEMEFRYYIINHSLQSPGRKYQHLKTRSGFLKIMHTT